MKKSLIIIIILFIYCFGLKPEKAYCQEYNLDANIEEKALSEPLSLPIFDFNTNTSLHTGSDNWSTVAPIVGVGIPTVIYGGLKTLFGKNTKPGRLNLYDVSNKSGNTSNNNGFNSIYGEEILCNINLKNSDRIIIHPDTVMYVKIPEKFKYSENSFRFNNKKLTDFADNDRLKYTNDDSILELNLGGIHQANIEFGIRSLKNNIDISSLCLIKFKSKSRKTETPWESIIKN